MASDRETLHERVMEAYDAKLGERPEKAGNVNLADLEQGQLMAMVDDLRGALGIRDDGSMPEGTLEDLVDYLHERWDGETSDDEA